MSKTDFQNGFALGMASGGVNPSPLTEKYLAEQLAEFKEKEIDYKTIYEYDTDLLPNINYTVSENKTLHYTSNGEQGYATDINVFLLVAQTDNSTQGFKKVVSSPFEFSTYIGESDGKARLKIENLDCAKDILFEDGEGDTIYISQAIQNYVHQEACYDVDFNFNTQNIEFTDGSMGLYLVCNITFYTLFEEIADELLSLGIIFKNINPYRIYFQNVPEIETIDAEYLGGE